MLSITHQTRAVIARQVLLTDGHQTPEGLFCRHVHEEDSGNGALGLTVPVLGVVDRVGLQHVEHVTLSDSKNTPSTLNCCCCCDIL